MGSGEVRDRSGASRSGGLDDAQARVGEPAEELQLGVEADDRLLVLQPVPRAHFPDRDPPGQRPGSGDRQRQAKFADAQEIGDRFKSGQPVIVRYTSARSERAAFWVALPG